MHLLPGERDSAHARLKRWRKARFRAMVVRLISRFANYEGPGGGPSVAPKLMADGDVGVALSVLYLPFAEIDFDKSYGAPPAPGYFEDLLDQLQLVEDHAASEDGMTVAHDGAELRAALDNG